MASSLTFPRATFAKLSPHPFLLANLQPSDPDVAPTRTNGRSPHQARPPQVNASSLSHAHGSAVVRTGDTTVICGVRGEILPVASIPQYRLGGQNGSSNNSSSPAAVDELKNYDLLVPNVELATGCAPSFLPGVPPTALAQTLSTKIYSLLHSCGLLSADDLRIWYAPGEQGEDNDGGDVRMGETPGEDAEVLAAAPELMAFWTLYIDLLFVSFDGNPLDAAWAAVLAALRDTKLPRARWDADVESVVCARGEETQQPLPVRGLPIACTAAVFEEKEHREHHGEGRHWVLVDPDRLEERLCREKVTVVVDKSSGETRVKSLSKHGGTVLGPEFMRDFARCAEQRWEEYRQAMGVKLS